MSTCLRKRVFWVEDAPRVLTSFCFHQMIIEWYFIKFSIKDSTYVFQLKTLLMETLKNLCPFTSFHSIRVGISAIYQDWNSQPTKFKPNQIYDDLEKGWQHLSPSRKTAAKTQKRDFLLKFIQQQWFMDLGKCLANVV